MTFPEQIDRLVTKLTELTESDKVDWQETGNANTYLAPVDKFVVTINKGGSEVYGGYSFQILDNTGRAIEGDLASFRGPEIGRGPCELATNARPLRNSEKAGSSLGKGDLRPPCVPRPHRLGSASAVAPKIKVYL